MPRPKLSREKLEKIKALMLEFRKEAEEGNLCTFERMSESERFKIGKQWDSDDLVSNSDRGKFSITINECLPIVLNVAGTEEQNPLDYVVRNVKGGTQMVADVVTALTKNILDKSDAQEEAGRSFETGATNGRGFIGADISHKYDPINGDVVIKEYDPYMVLPDPTCTKYDYNEEKGGAKYIIVDEWIDKTQVEAAYPKKAKAISEANFEVEADSGWWGAKMCKRLFGSRGASIYTTDDYRQGCDDDFGEGNIRKQKFNYRQSTIWWKEWKKGVYVQRLDDPLNFLMLTEPKAISQARKMAKLSALNAAIDPESKGPNIRVIDTDSEGRPLTVPMLNKTIMYGDVFVDHIEDPFNGVSLYPIQRFAPYFDLGYEYSIVENLIGPQRLLNYASSTAVNLLKGLANSGWVVGKGSEQDKAWLEDHSGEDRIIIDKSKYGSLDKIQANPFPAGFDATAERSKQNMREISQVDLEAPRSSNESGKALAIREAQSTKTKGVVFRNWRQTNMMQANFVVEVIRYNEIHNDDEIRAIIAKEDLIDDDTMNQAKGVIFRQIEQNGGEIPEQPEELNPLRMSAMDTQQQADHLDAYKAEMKTYKEFVEQVEAAAVPIAEEMTIDMFRSRQEGRYGTKVDISAASPTRRIAERQEVFELNESLVATGQPGIARDDLIRVSDVTDKEKMIKNVPQAPAQEVA